MALPAPSCVGCEPSQVEVEAGAEVKPTEVDFEGARCDLPDSFDSFVLPSCHVSTLTWSGVEVGVEFRTSLPLSEKDSSGSVKVSSPFPFVSNPSPEATALAWATAGALVGSVAWGALRAGRYLLVALGLYTNISDDALLDDPNRRRIFELIRSEPGISTREVATRLNLAWGTVTHHLLKLERRRFVVSKKFGKYRRYFVNGAASREEEKERWAALRVQGTEKIARLVFVRPGLTQREVSEALGISSSTVLWHVRRLEETGLLQVVREGRTVRYYPASSEIRPSAS